MQFDFASVKARMTSALSQMASWADILFYSTNARLIDAVSEGIGQLASEDEFLTRETKWDLAENTSSLVTGAKFRGYTPKRSIGATGLLRVSTSPTFNAPYITANIPIPQWSAFSTPGGLGFVAVASESLTPSDNYIDINIVEGVLKTQSFIAQGLTFETFDIINNSIENYNYLVYRNGQLYTQIGNINDAAATDTVYELDDLPDFSGIELTFGDGNFGQLLNNGDVITIYYVQTDGAAGNVESIGLITIVNSNFLDALGNTVTLYCTNLANVDGGLGSEGLESIRSQATDTFQAGGKCVTNDDYAVNIEKISFVQKATVWGAYEFDLDNNVDLWTWIPTQDNLVNVSAFTTAGENLTTAQKNQILAIINPIKPPGDIVSFTDPDYLELSFHIQIYVEDSSFVLSAVKAATIEGVSTQFGVLNMNFKQPIYETGNIGWKGYIDTIPGVLRHTSYVELIKESNFSSPYFTNISLELFPVAEESVNVYVLDTTIIGGTWTLIGTTDGNGNINGQPGYNLTGSTIN